MDHQTKTYNMVTSATSLKNYEFDFGNLSGFAGASGASGKSSGMGAGSLMQQKTNGISAPINQSSKGPALANPIAPNFRPMAAPWEAAAEKMKPSSGAETVSVAPPQSVQASYKEKPPATGIGGVNSASSAQATWRPSYLSSASPGTTVGKPDPLASLWGTSGVGPTSGGASQKPGGSSSAAADPFADLFGGAKQSLSASKASAPSNAGKKNEPLSMASLRSAMPPAAGGGGPGLGSGSSIGSSGGRPPAAAGLASDSFGGFASASATSSSQGRTADQEWAAFGSVSGTQGTDPFGAFGSGGSGSSAAGQSVGAGLGGFPDPISPGSSSTAQMPSSGDGFDAFFGAPATSSKSAPSLSSLGDPLEDLLFKPKAAAAAPGTSGGAIPSDDWAAAFGSSAASVAIDEHSVAGTVELEGLPPPPAGLTVAAASEKGEGFYKAGQFADAIKWLLWAEALIGEAEGNRSKEAQLGKVLTTRAGCYKEAGEMKKAVADISMVVKFDPTNSSVLMQRAVLYEGMEKYRKGVEDLREVLKLDPSNRTAMSMLNRLNKLVD